MSCGRFIKLNAVDASPLASSCTVAFSIVTTAFSALKISVKAMLHFYLGYIERTMDRARHSYDCHRVPWFLRCIQRAAARFKIVNSYYECVDRQTPNRIQV